MVRYFLFLLYPFELLYRLGFHIVIAYKRRHGNKDPLPFKIIAVGNLTVGGTGKSVVVPFLVDLLGHDKSAVVLRGYKGSFEREQRAALVSDGTRILVTREQSGDEAMMYAQQLGVPIAVGADRAQACNVLTSMPSISYVILDDAYQNYRVKKDIEILLLDARAPFDNGHCLPLGRLREKDYTRATFIILTHADKVDRTTLEYIKRVRLRKFAYEKIYEGKHASAGIYRDNKDRVEAAAVKSNNFVVVAGVGSFNGVVASVQQSGCNVRATQQYRDHHNYTLQDIHDIHALMHKTSCDSVITTAKDWVKLAPLLDQDKEMGRLPVFVIRVAFEFLSPSEQSRLGDALHAQLVPLTFVQALRSGLKS